jgi:putative tryptophan/tyrosine transport system substrate-binding protein
MLSTAPGGNATGATFMGVELVAKRLELLKERLPGPRASPSLSTQTIPASCRTIFAWRNSEWDRLGLDMVVVKAGDESAIGRAVAAAAEQSANALIIGNDAYLISRSEQVASSALHHSLPTICEAREGVAAGLFLSYGPNQAETFRHAGLYVARILNGEKPADLPVIQPTTYVLSVSLRTARALGLTIPPTLLARADEVIE